MKTNITPNNSTHYYITRIERMYNMYPNKNQTNEVNNKISLPDVVEEKTNDPPGVIMPPEKEMSPPQLG